MSIGAILGLAGIIIALIALFKPSKESEQTRANTKNIAENKKDISALKKKVKDLDETTPKAIEKTNGETWLIYNGKTIYKTENK